MIEMLKVLAGKSGQVDRRPRQCIKEYHRPAVLRPKYEVFEHPPIRQPQQSPHLKPFRIGRFALTEHRQGAFCDGVDEIDLTGDAGLFEHQLEIGAPGFVADPHRLAGFAQVACVHQCAHQGLFAQCQIMGTGQGAQTIGGVGICGDQNRCGFGWKTHSNGFLSGQQQIGRFAFPRHQGLRRFDAIGLRHPAGQRLCLGLVFVGTARREQLDRRVQRQPGFPHGLIDNQRCAAVVDQSDPNGEGAQNRFEIGFPFLQAHHLFRDFDGPAEVDHQIAEVVAVVRFDHPAIGGHLYLLGQFEDQLRQKRIVERCLVNKMGQAFIC